MKELKPEVFSETKLPHRQERKWATEYRAWGEARIFPEIKTSPKSPCGPVSISIGERHTA